MPAKTHHGMMACLSMNLSGSGHAAFMKSFESCRVSFPYLLPSFFSSKRRDFLVSWYFTEATPFHVLFHVRSGITPVLCPFPTWYPYSKRTLPFQHFPVDQRISLSNLGDGLLNHGNTILLVELLHQGLGDVGAHGSENALAGDLAAQDLLDSDGAGNTDGLGHGRVALGVAVLDEGRGAGLAGAVGVLDLELVLEHDQVALALLKLHLLLQSGAEGVERVATRGDGLVGEETDPAETAENALLVLGGLEGGLGEDGGLEILGAGGSGADNLFRGLLPGGLLAQALASGVVKETNVDESLDELREALVTEGATDDGLSLGDVVALLIDGRVAVGVGDESVARVDEVGLGHLHEVLALNLDNLAILPPLAGVAESKQNTARRPGELVAERVVGVLGRGETTAVGEEREDLAASLVDLIDGLDGVQVIDTGVKL